MPSRSPSPRDPTVSRDHSQTRSEARSPQRNELSRSPRRSRTPGSRSRSLGRSRTPTPREARVDDRNGDRMSVDRSRSRSRMRSLSGSRSPERHSRRDSRSPSRSRSRSRTPPRSAKIVVEKLTKNVNEEHLRDIFGSYGEITELDLPKNPQFGTNRGTAYIVYASTTSAEDAITFMHDGQIDGAAVSVSIVLPRRRLSRSPPPARNSHPERFGPRGGHSSGFRGPPPGSRGGRFRSPFRRRSPSPRGHGGRGRGSRGRPDNSYRPGSYTPSRSRSPKRTRSPSFSSRSRSRSPPRRGGGGSSGHGRRPSPPRRGGGSGGQRRRSRSYSDYSSRSDRSRSRERRRH